MSSQSCAPVRRLGREALQCVSVPGLVLWAADQLTRLARTAVMGMLRGGAGFRRRWWGRAAILSAFCGGINLTASSVYPALSYNRGHSTNKQ